MPLTRFDALLVCAALAAGVFSSGCAPRSHAVLTVANEDSAPIEAPAPAVSVPAPMHLETAPPVDAPAIAAAPAEPPSETTAGWAADDAAAARPLDVGDAIPNVRLVTSEGAPVDLLDLVRSQPAVLIFYRGGWCPYCSKHLSALQEAEAELQRLGYRIVAISPDRPAKITDTSGELHLSYLLLSDSKAEAVRAFGLAFTVDDGTIQKYLTYGINLDEASGEPHHQLPVPAVFIVGRDGVIRYRHYNPDYKVRLSKDELLAKARELK